MKITIAICAALTTAILTATAEDKPKASPAAANEGLQERVRGIDAHVRKVEENMAKLTRKEATLDAAAVAKATDEKWTKIHAYLDGGKVARMKIYPATGSKTEEFYYEGERLVFVFIEPDGAGKKGHDPKAKGTKYYFDTKGLFAVVTNGKMADSLDDSSRAMGKKLQRESKAFRKAAK